VRGRFNSSITRVRPVFTALIERDPTGRSWLPALLELCPRRDRVPTWLRAEPGELLPELLATRLYKDKVLGEYGDTKVASLAALGLAESYNTTHEWQKLADTCKLLLDRYPHSNEAYRAKDLLKKAQKNGATLSLVGTPAPLDTTRAH
jgi:thymidylate kinase